MKSKMASKFAFRNMRANSLLLTPFLIASSVMGTLFFIMASLGQNKYIEANHMYVSTLIKIGIVIVGIFTFVFILYANSFLTKRRNKEFALYGILGLEKKHIAKIISIEYILNFLTVSFFSIAGGFVLGKLAFVILNRITKNMTAKIIDYNFSTSSAILTLIFLAIIFILIYLTMIFRIGKSTPIELLSKQKKAEGEPKSKFIIGTLGFIILCVGYYLSITSKGSIKSFGRFFPAVFAVIIGTYLVFIAFSILVLKLLKRNRNLYYKSKHFLSISGMLYRMKSNAVSLASIALLSTSIIVTLSTTFTINSSIKSILDESNPNDFVVSTGIEGNTNELLKNGEKREKEILKLLDNILKDDEKIKI
ncbi:efflux ABC transporter, permease protein [Parvimonas sp. oral taxon 393 str. F0440]|nr:efflux ABC transporter, permease protein [Parvimonas sp. oral taxon 393 str. F0440]